MSSISSEKFHLYWLSESSSPYSSFEPSSLKKWIAVIYEFSSETFILLIFPPYKFNVSHVPSIVPTDGRFSSPSVISDTSWNCRPATILRLSTQVVIISIDIFISSVVSVDRTVRLSISSPDDSWGHCSYTTRQSIGYELTCEKQIRKAETLFKTIFFIYIF